MSKPRIPSFFSAILTIALTAVLGLPQKIYANGCFEAFLFKTESIQNRSSLVIPNWRPWYYDVQKRPLMTGEKRLLSSPELSRSRRGIGLFNTRDEDPLLPTPKSNWGASSSGSAKPNIPLDKQPNSFTGSKDAIWNQIAVYILAATESGKDYVSSLLENLAATKKGGSLGMTPMIFADHVLRNYERYDAVRDDLQNSMKAMRDELLLSDLFARDARQDNDGNGNRNNPIFGRERRPGRGIGFEEFRALDPKEATLESGPGSHGEPRAQPRVRVFKPIKPFESPNPQQFALLENLARKHLPKPSLVKELLKEHVFVEKDKVDEEVQKLADKFAKDFIRDYQNEIREIRAELKKENIERSEREAELLLESHQSNFFNRLGTKIRLLQMRMGLLFPGLSYLASVLTSQEGIYNPEQARQHVEAILREKDQELAFLAEVVANLPNLDRLEIYEFIKANSNILEIARDDVAALKDLRHQRQRAREALHKRKLAQPMGSSSSSDGSGFSHFGRPLNDPSVNEGRTRNSSEQEKAPLEEYMGKEYNEREFNSSAESRWVFRLFRALNPSATPKQRDMLSSALEKKAGELRANLTYLLGDQQRNDQGQLGRIEDRMERIQTQRLPELKATQAVFRRRIKDLSSDKQQNKDEISRLSNELEVLKASILTETKTLQELQERYEDGLFEVWKNYILARNFHTLPYGFYGEIKLPRPVMLPDALIADRKLLKRAETYTDYAFHSKKVRHRIVNHVRWTHFKDLFGKTEWAARKINQRGKKLFGKEWYNTHVQKKLRKKINNLYKRAFAALLSAIGGGFAFDYALDRLLSQWVQELLNTLVGDPALEDTEPPSDGDNNGNDNSNEGGDDGIFDPPEEFQN
jgi:hypothetical protein